jgi:hypothetical protein
VIWRTLRRTLLAGAALLFASGPASAALAASVPSIRQGGGTVDYQILGAVVPGRPVVVEFRATSPVGNATAGSLTVSMSGDPNLEIVSETPNATVFQPGQAMYNFANGQQTPISTPAVELYLASWPGGSTQTLRLRLTPSQPFTVQARASFRGPNGFIHLPGSGTPDQQGAPTRLIDIAPRAQQQAATATPVPPTPAPPTPTTAAPTLAPAPTAAKPTTAPATAAPTTAAPPAPALGPAQTGNTPVPTSPPPSTATAASASGDSPSLPWLLAGFGIMALGVAIGIVALMLVLRRRTERPVAWSGPTGTYPPGPYPPPAYPQPGYAPPSYPPPGYPTPIPSAGPVAPPTPAGRPAPWDRPPTPSPDQTGGDNRDVRWGRPPTAPWEGAVVAGAGRASDTPSPQTDIAEGWRDTGPTDDATPRPPSVGGIGQAQVTPAGERYTQRSLVARGGMGSVYKAYDARLRRWVALKIMHADLGLRPGFVDRFIREAQVAAMLEHPNIVTVYDVEPVGNTIQMVQSWIEGQDLQRLLQSEGALSPERAANILDQLASALDAAHLRDHPVLHRDIKPSNIMVGPQDRVILTDFGIARLIGDVSLTQTGEIVGTPAYMAPELVEGDEADARADIYALGVVLFQMLTGQAPFRAETPLAMLHAHVHTPPPAPRTITPTLPPAVDVVLLQVLEKDPNHRYQSAGGLARAFRAAIGRS